MVTDAKALYDSYHREGVSSTVVDKRVSLEIRVMKERLQQLGGNFRWMSSERQMADGLTKESARLLLAERLRHGRLKMSWDPGYVAAKKKTKTEIQDSLAESTARKPVPRKPTKKVKHVQEDVIEYDDVPENEYENPNEEDIQTMEAEQSLEVVENVFMARTSEAIKYDFAARHVGIRKEYITKRRMQNDIAWWFWFFAVSLMPSLVKSEADQCFAEDEIHATEDTDITFGVMVTMVLVLVFMLGRWSAMKMKKTTCEAGVQKDEALVPARLREILQVSQTRCRELYAANVELDKALKLALGDMAEAFEVASSAEQSVRTCLREMEDHAIECPFRVDIAMANRHGRRWHHAGCNALDGTPVQPCQLCIGDGKPPPDREDRFFGGCLRDDIENWLATFTTLRRESAGQ